MTERISRPPVRLKSALPDGALNGTGDVAGHFLKTDPAPRYALIELVRRERVYNDDTDAEIAVLGISAIEFPTDQDALQRLLLDHRAERTGAGMLPFDEPETDADRARELEHRIAVWADQNGVDARQEWEAYFGPGDQAPVGPRGAGLPHLLEFCGERDIQAQPLAATPAGPDDEPNDTGDEDDTDPVDEDPAGDPLAGVPAGRAWLGDPAQQFSDN